MKIEHFIYLNDSWLCVFYTNSNYWQYSILFNNFTFYNPDEIYYTSEAALRVGKEEITILSGK